jgi:membrane associated rhomboid family serine protease
MKKFKQHLAIVLGIFAVVTLVEVVNLLSGRALTQFGIVPHDSTHLLGILLSPLLHGSFFHYLSNIVPLCVFSFFILQYGTRAYLWITLLLIVAIGLAVWLFARSAVHVGASGLVYGYLGFLLLAGWRSGNWKLLALSVFVAIFYGGLIFGVLPTRMYVSWESHLFGFLLGLLLARCWPVKR